MAHPRRFRFGVQLSKAANGHDWAELARKTEALGYSTLFMPDHFGDQLAPMPALMAAADATNELKVGALVHDNDYKHPVVFAKEIATIDVLSGGRLELGVGAGWMNTDYEQSGIQHDSAKVRVDRLEEGVAVMKGLFAEGPFSFEGEHYTITNHDALPKPVQKPYPPFIIGGGGKRVLSIAAREADIVGINPAIKSGNVDHASATDATAAATDRKYGWVKEAAGDRFDDLEINCLCFAVIITDDPHPVHEMMAGMFDVAPEEVADVPHVMVGTVDSICEQLVERRERWGMSYFVVQGDTALEAAAPIVAKLAGS